MILKRAIFLDRDGVINRKMPEDQYVLSNSDFNFLPGVLDALRVLKKEGFCIIVTTNQRCIGKKLMTETALNKIHLYMVRTIRNHGDDVDAIYYCPHEITEGCTCRKPQPGMILQALQDFRIKGVEIDMQTSYMIGDSDSDIEAGKMAGLKTIKIGRPSGVADSSRESLYGAALTIICNLNHNLSISSSENKRGRVRR